MFGASFNFPDPAQRLFYDDPLAASTPDCSFSGDETFIPQKLTGEPTPICSFSGDETIIPLKEATSTPNCSFSEVEIVAANQTQLPKPLCFTDFDADFERLALYPMEFAATNPMSAPLSYDVIEFPITPKNKSIEWECTPYEEVCARHCNYEIKDYCDCLTRKTIHLSLEDVGAHVILRKKLKY
jgi:hypothetical protein